MTTGLAQRAVVALIWRGVALGGEKVIFLLRLIVLARLLAPEDFGLVAIGMTVLAISLSLTDFGVVAALIHRPASDKRHLDTAWTIGLIRGAGVALILVLSASWIADAFAEPRAASLIRALAVTALIQAAASIEVARLNRELRFGGLAGLRLAAAIANTVVAIVLAPHYGPWALVWGAIAGAAVQTGLSYIVAPYRPGLRLADDATASIARFGRWIFVIGVLGVAADAILRWLIATRLGVVELGLFFMAVRLAFLPGQLVSELVSEIAFPVYAQLQADRQKAARTFRGLLIAVAALLVPACAVFAWLVPELVQYVLGERWQGAVVVMQLLILSSIVGLLGDGLTPVLKGTGHPAGVAVMDLLQLLLIVALGWPLVGAYGLAGAGFAWLVSIAVSQLLAAWYARRLFDHPFKGLATPMLAIAATAIVATAVAAIANMGAAKAFSGAAGVASAVLASAGTAFVVTLILDRYLRLGILQSISGALPWLKRFTGSAPA